MKSFSVSNIAFAETEILGASLKQGRASIKRAVSANPVHEATPKKAKVAALSRRAGFQEKRIRNESRYLDGGALTLICTPRSVAPSAQASPGLSAFITMPSMPGA